MAMPTSDRVVRQAKRYVRSSRYGSPNKFTRWFGFGNQTVEWCAIWIYYVLAQCGGKLLMAGCSNKAYVPTIMNWAKKKGYWRTGKPKKGDLVLFDWNKNKVADHIGFVVEDLGNGYVKTIEGNTSNVSNGNGGCVQIRTRPKYYILGYVRLPYGKKSKPTTSKSPFTKGKIYTLQANMRVRTGAGTGYRQKKRSELTNDGIANSLEQTYAVMKKGTGVTCLETKGNWIRVPSGWICGKQGNKIYIK